MRPRAELLDKAESFLRVKKFSDHWRAKSQRVFSLELFFSNTPGVLGPFCFGMAKKPSLTLWQGNLFKADTWQRFIGVFQPNFLGFAIRIS